MEDYKPMGCTKLRIASFYMILIGIYDVVNLVQIFIAVSRITPFTSLAIVLIVSQIVLIIFDFFMSLQGFKCSTDTSCASMCMKIGYIRMALLVISFLANIAHSKLSLSLILGLVLNGTFAGLYISGASDNDGDYRYYEEAEDDTK